MKPKRSQNLHAHGHAGGHLRDALLDVLDYRRQTAVDWWNHLEMDFWSEREQRWWEGCSPRRRARWLLGQLWHCRDIVPGSTRQLFVDAGDVQHDCEVMTYARMVRLLAKDLERNQEVAECPKNKA